MIHIYVPFLGGWWRISAETDVKGGLIAIETLPYTYIMALDNGHFVIGGPHPPGMLLPIPANN